MPMIDVYAAAGTFQDPHTLAKDLAAAVMRWEQVPELPLFENNTAAFIHDLDPTAMSNVAGDSNYVRVQVLTPLGSSIARNNSASSRSSPRSSPPPQATKTCVTAPGCSSPSRPTAAGESPVTRTPMPTSQRSHAQRSMRDDLPACAGEMRRQEQPGSVERRGRFVEDRVVGLEDMRDPRGDVEGDLDVSAGGLSRQAEGVVEENLVRSGLDDQGRQPGQVGE